MFLTYVNLWVSGATFIIGLAALEMGQYFSSFMSFLISFYCLMIIILHKNKF